MSSSGSGGGGQSGTSVRVATAQRTAGNYTLNSTTWANVDTGLDLTLAAVAGDKIEVGLAGLLGGSTNGFLDMASIVAGSPVNYWSGSAGGASAQGVLAWRHESDLNVPLGGSVIRAAVSGDLSGGNIVLRLRYRTAAATNLTLYGDTNLVLNVWAKNLGQG
jgi:hypothetical protein